MHQSLKHQPAQGRFDHLISAARAAQSQWAERPLKGRIAVLGAVRQRVAQQSEAIARAHRSGSGRALHEILVSEVLPFADALKFLEREAEALLKPRVLGSRGRPAWLFGTQTEILREPRGLVVVLGPYNYPLLLPGVQAIQALAAGNAVIWKPGRGGSAAAQAIAALFEEAGLPGGLLTVLDETVETAAAILDLDIDHVVLTGSAATGREVAHAIEDRAIPSVMELSGNDPMFILPGADIDLVAQAAVYGLAFNQSQTCIAPRRIIVVGDYYETVRESILEGLKQRQAPALTDEVLGKLGACASRAGTAGLTVHTVADRSGSAPAFALAEAREPGDAALSDDIFAPVAAFFRADNEAQALALAARSDYALGATVFGPAAEARRFAANIDAGWVLINDVIVTSADPRIPFGGRKASGHGLTRGGEGLLEMTRVKTVQTRAWRFRPHYDAPQSDDVALASAYILTAHGRGLGPRLRAAWDLINHLARRKP